MYAIYGNIYHQYTPFMLAYIPAPWILWVYIYISYYWAALFAGSNGSPSTSSALGFPSPSRTALGPSVTNETCPASCGKPPREPW